MLLWLITEHSYFTWMCTDTRAKHTEITRSLCPIFSNLCVDIFQLPQLWLCNSNLSEFYLSDLKFVLSGHLLFANCQMSSHGRIFTTLEVVSKYSQPRLIRPINT